MGSARADGKTCDDRFTFNTDIGLQASFVFENVRYTLEIAGFSQGTNPYDRFWS